jgi:hypothetical protein
MHMIDVKYAVLSSRRALPCTVADVLSVDCYTYVNALLLSLLITIVYDHSLRYSHTALEYMLMRLVRIVLMLHTCCCAMYICTVMIGGQ